jgi:hypothetical protein
LHDEVFSNLTHYVQKNTKWVVFSNKNSLKEEYQD